MRYRRPELMDVTECCGQPVSKKVQATEEAFNAYDRDLYMCSVCQKEDYLSAFLKTKLVDEYVFCFNCDEETAQNFKSGDEEIIQTECYQCHKINEFNLAHYYCETCQDYKPVVNEGDLLNDKFICQSCDKEVLLTRTFY